jgi:alkyl hydroperoxide reductase subunit AhpC
MIADIAGNQDSMVMYGYILGDPLSRMRAEIKVLHINGSVNTEVLRCCLIVDPSKVLCTTMIDAPSFGQRLKESLSLHFFLRKKAKKKKARSTSVKVV